MSSAFYNTLGCILVGMIFNTCLMGVLIPHFYRYWATKFNDPLWIKLFVLFLFLFNASQTAAVCYLTWFFMVENFTNKAAVQIDLWPFPYTAISKWPLKVNSQGLKPFAGTAILALIFQVFQTWRMYAFNKNKPLALFLGATALATCGLGVAAGIRSWILADLKKLFVLGPIVKANLAMQCGLDIFIAAALSVIFERSKTSLKRTDQVLNRLIQTAVQSGFFTAVFALGSLFAFHFGPRTSVISVFALPIGRIYTHTLMDHFNSRLELRRLLNNDGNVITMPQFAGPHGRAGAVDTIMLSNSRLNASESTEHIGKSDLNMSAVEFSRPEPDV
ncbi:unnamed protein product [Mycena citricolor]|uniref:DUF6534 domain-containing protein n=1 Tax=Mycena citricolor TaxID=2018698 RepID=A0AAD2HYY9_9AGAR|nr:unnamed protein product [Mycena citricolor]